MMLGTTNIKLTAWSYRKYKTGRDHVTISEIICLVYNDGNGPG